MHIHWPGPKGTVSSRHCKCIVNRVWTKRGHVHKPPSSPFPSEREPQEKLTRQVIINAASRHVVMYPCPSVGVLVRNHPKREIFLISLSLTFNSFLACQFWIVWHRKEHCTRWWRQLVITLISIIWLGNTVFFGRSSSLNINYSLRVWQNSFAEEFMISEEYCLHAIRNTMWGYQSLNFCRSLNHVVSYH